MKRIYAIIVVLGLGYMLTAGVASIATGASSPDQSRKEETQGDFIRGAQVWANNCTRCHNIRGPKEFNDQQWKVIVTHMRVRAGLTGQDVRDVLAFMQQSN
ncbi:MAG: cytochrome c [Opitutaceae bacterium]